MVPLFLDQFCEAASGDETLTTECCFADLSKVCVEFLGERRQTGTSHAIFKTPWEGDPRINIQNDHGRAKPYQVRQVLLAIDKLKGGQDETQSPQPED